MKQIKIPSPQTRLLVYKEALKYLNDDSEYELCKIIGLSADGAGLCLLIPCIWLKCHYCDKFFDENGNQFHYQQMTKYFPEINVNYIINMETRINALINGIKDIENGNN